MIHIRPSAAGIMFLQHSGSPSGINFTDEGLKIPENSLCVDVLNYLLYQYKLGTWIAVVSQGAKGDTGTAGTNGLAGKDGTTGLTILVNNTVDLNMAFNASTYTYTISQKNNYTVDSTTTDYNSYTNTGIYRFANSSRPNVPETANNTNTIILRVTNVGGDYILQEVFDTQLNKSYIRTKNGSTWNGWKLTQTTNL